MSFLIKGILKKLLNQYLNIVDNIVMEKGYIQLPCGHLNHQSINNKPQLLRIGVQIVSSEYLGLAISLPIMEIQSKPIIIKAQSLKVVVQIDDVKANKYQSNLSKDEKMKTKAANQESPSKNRPHEKQQKQVPQQGSDSYIKGLVNRLLANMQLELKSLQIIIIHKQSSSKVHSYRLDIHNLIIKNSLSLLQANLLKKIVCLGSISIQRLKMASDKADKAMKSVEYNHSQLQNNQQFILSIMDLNMSLNIDFKKINAILLLDSIKIKIQKNAIMNFIAQIVQKLKNVAKKTQNQQSSHLIHKRQRQIQTLKNQQAKQNQSISIDNNKQLIVESSKNSKIALDSLQVKINQIYVDLSQLSEEGRTYQLYTLAILNIQIFKQNLRQRNIFMGHRIIFQAQNIFLRDKAGEILAISVNKLKEDNILNRTIYYPQYDKPSNKSLEDYDQVIKNKKRQFYIKIDNNNCGNPIIMIDTLSIWTNFTHQFARDLKNLLFIVRPTIMTFVAMISSQKSKLNSSRQWKQHEKFNLIADQKQNSYDLAIRILNSAIDINLVNKGQPPLSICLFVQEQLSIKISEKETHADIHEKILLYVNVLKVACISQVNLAILNSHEKKNPQIIVSVGQISVETQVHELIAGISNLKKFIGNQQIVNLQKIIGQISQGIVAFNNEKSNLILLKQTHEKQKIKNTIPYVYLRINYLLVSLGQLNKSNNYFPIFIVEIADIKCSKIQQLIKLKLLFSSLSCISPHDLSSSVICKGTNFSIKRSKNSEINSGQIRISAEQKFGCSFKIMVKDPINIQFQEQHACLLLNIIDSVQSVNVNNRKKNSMFILVKNLTKTKIKLQNSQPSNSNNDQPIIGEKVNKRQQNNDSLIFQDVNIFKPEVPNQFILQPDSECQIFLANLSFKVIINSEISEIVNIQKLKISDSDKNSVVQNGVYQLPIIFNYQQDCSYILQVKIKSPCLYLSFKYKYELHIFEGISPKLNHIQKMYINCNDSQKQLLYIKYKELEPNDTQFDKDNDVKINSKICFGWQLLEDEKLDQLTFEMTTSLPNHPKNLKISKLISNNIHYKLYGLYAPESLSEEDKILIGPNSQLNPKFNYFYYYILEQISIINSIADTAKSGSLSHRYYLMPFLIIKNNLEDTILSVKISNKKFENIQSYLLDKKMGLVAFGGAFDYYMKQYMIQIQISQQMNTISDLCNKIQTVVDHQKKKQQQTSQRILQNTLDNTEFESEQHYFNTFFMVDEIFESVIELRSSDNKKRCLRIRESFIKKTKILQIENTLSLINQSEVSLKISFSSNQHANIKKSEKKFKQKQLLLQSNSILQSSRKIKKDDIITIIYYFEKFENKIQVSVKDLQEFSNKVVLSFNFCKIPGCQFQDENNQKRENVQQYVQILLKMQLRYNNNTQVLIFTPFITFNNICNDKKLIKLNNRLLKSKQASKKLPYSDSMSLFLPPNTNKDYNNKWMPVNIQKIYQDLFIRHESWIIEGDSDLMQVEIFINQDQIAIRFDKKTVPIKFYELLVHKIVEHNQSVYSLVKSMKEDAIQFYFSDKLFNTNLSNVRYFLFNNQTSQNFLMSSGDEQYAKYLLFPKDQSSKDNNTTNSQQLSEQTIVQQKIYISGRGQQNKIPALNFLLNKDRYDIFLCDKHKKKLQSFNAKKLQKLGIRQQKFAIENFIVLNLEQQKILENSPPLSNTIQSRNLKANPDFQLITNSLNFKILSKRKKIGLSINLKVFNFRFLQIGKLDALIKDLSVSVLTEQKNSLQVSQSPFNYTLHQILRIPEESYFLVEGKIFDSKIILLKNLFIKCKIIDLQINKQLLSLLMAFQKFAKQVSEGEWKNLKNKQKNEKPDDFIVTPFSYAKNARILSLAQQKIILTRSLHLHQVNLCLNVQTTNNTDFSNIINLPELSISNKCYKFSNFSKDVSNHYLTNIIAKFPKISYLYQNLRSPISMIKSLIQARQVILDKDQQEQRRRYYWSRAHINFQNQYDSNYLLKKPKLGIKPIKNGSGIFYTANKINLHNDLISSFLSQQYFTTNLQQKQKVLCNLNNIIYSNIARQLPVSSGCQPQYILTNKNIYMLVELTMYSASSGNMSATQMMAQNNEIHTMQQKTSLKEVDSIKIWRYNSNSGELVINFKKKGNIIKIVDSLQACEKILNFVRAAIV